ncbi:ABC transporter substrate-binding protein [Mycolicibacterium palauense]|uniref:ABC transporter substrate-binding protein n=1 Tax=Mycolicibacterium palauense TaxID=2034511 RepID=UPI00159B918F|nr:ABC transporter substrate-binding protein [Mycolicibacterium palauense]
MDRRLFLRDAIRVGAAVAAVAATPTLASCSRRSTGPEVAAAAVPPTPAIQLNWILDSSYAGMYVAKQRHYFRDAGFDGVTLMAGGADIAPDPIVATGKAALGVSGPSITAQARNQGAPLVIVGAICQINPYTVLSMPQRPLREPADLVGKTVAVDAVSMTPWRVFCTLNDIDPDSVKTVPANYDLSLLTSGAVDGFLGFTANELVALQLQGADPVSMGFDDHGYRSVSETLMVDTETLAADPAGVKRMLLALARGWTDVIRDPDAAADLTESLYGRDLGLDVATERATCQQVARSAVPRPGASGVLDIPDGRVAETVQNMAAGGVHTTAEELFDLGPIREVHRENPEL